MKIAFIYGKQPSSTLTKIFTDSTCYHVAFVDEASGKMWDMHKIRRRRQWPHYDPKKVILADTPVPVSVEYLEHKLETDKSEYGYLDYLLFALRPLYHLFGKSTRNAKGIICSEMVWDDLVENGWDVRYEEVPEPAVLEEILLGRRDAIKHRQ